jgi:hypothetical protein
MGPGSPSNANIIEETRKQIDRLFAEVAQLAEMDIPPSDFYGEFLKRVLHALAAPAGAIWGRTAQGNLQLQFQINMKNVGLDQSEDARAAHDELLRQAVMNPRPINLPPYSSMGPEGQGPAAGNPTGHLLLLVPIVVDAQVAGLLEVWQAPDRHPNAIPGFINFMARMAELATRYIRNSMLRQMVGQQQLWVQLEAFSRSIHGSLNPVEVGYLIVNEARRLCEADRISIGVRYAKKCVVEAISGADVVEKRSNLVQLMRALFDAVIAWGEKLIYSGSKDETLPPDVLKALDAYLAESNSKLLVVLPMKDERQGTDPKKLARSAIMMECFEPQMSAEQMVARLEVIARHATPALYNAVEHRRIPFRFLWMPIAKIQEGLGGKTKAIVTLILAAVVILIGVMIFVPYPLKMDAKGQVLPENRRFVYPPAPGTVVEFLVKPNDQVEPGAPLVRMYDDELREKLSKLSTEIAKLQRQIDSANSVLSNQNLTMTPGERQKLTADKESNRVEQVHLQRQWDALVEKTNADGRPGHEGEFWIKAPEFPPTMALGKEMPRWTVLNADFRENLAGKYVKPDTPLLRLGYKDGPWEVELKIPQKHIGQVLNAFVGQQKARKARLVAQIDKALAAGAITQTEHDDLRKWADKDDGQVAEPHLVKFVKDEAQRGALSAEDRDKLLGEMELGVDILVKSEPTRVFKGRLMHVEIAGDANPHKDDNNEAEPMVLATVRLSGPNIDPQREDLTKLAPYLLLTNTEVHSKIRCGTHAMGYSLFYGVWEFLYEKVWFALF